MIRTVGDLMYLLGAGDSKGLARVIQENTSTPTAVSVLRSGIEIGPMLGDPAENRMNNVKLDYPFTEEEWETAVSSVEAHSYRFLAKRSAIMGTLYSDLVDRPLGWCVDCGLFKANGRGPCSACSARSSQ